MMKTIRLTFLTLVSILIIITTSVDVPPLVAGETAGEYWRVLSSASLPPLPDGKSSPGLAGPVAGFLHQKILIAGGANFPELPPWQGGKKVWYRDVYLLEKRADNQFHFIRGGCQLPVETAYAATATTPYGIAVLGGDNQNGLLDRAYLLVWDSMRGTVTFDILPSLPEPCSNAAAIYLGTTLYLIGGNTASGPTSRVLALDLMNRRQSWQRMADLPRPTAFAAAVTQSDGFSHRIWLLGGRAKMKNDSVTEFYSNVCSWKPGEPNWREELPISDSNGTAVPLSASTAAAMGASGIVVFGGDDGKVFRLKEENAAQAESLTNPVEKEKLLAVNRRLTEEFPGFDRNIYLYNTITRRWCLYGQLPFPTPVTTTALSQSGQIIFPSGEIRPGIRTPEIRFLEPVPRREFGVVNYAVLLGYMILMLGLGAAFMRGNRDADSFFRCGGKLPWWAVGISIFATMLSAITFLSIPSKAYATNWYMLFFNLGITIAAPIVIAFYLPRFRAIQAVSAYQYLENRFNRLTRWFASGLFCLFMITRIAIVLYLPAIALNVVSGMNVWLCILVTGLVTLVYSTLGGMKAVVWGDVVQGIILVGGALLSLGWLICKTSGGPEGFLSLAASNGKLDTFNGALDLSQPVFWVVLAGGFAGSFITYTSDQTIIQRYMTTEDIHKASRSIWLNAIAVIPITIIFFLTGTALFTYYHSHPEELAPSLDKLDAIYPYYIVNGLPAGIAGLLIAAIFAASMSTLSSNINSASAALCTDFIKVFRPNLSAKGEVLSARVAGIAVGALGIGMALVLATWNIQSLWDQFNTFLGLFTGTLGALFFMGFFMKKVDGTGAACGVIGSVVILLMIRAHTSISFLLFGLIEIVLCCLIARIVSIFTRKR